MSPENPTHSQDTTQTERIDAYLKNADSLLTSVEVLQNGLANAKRRVSGGQAVDLEKILATANIQVAVVEHQARTMTSAQAKQSIADVSGAQLVEDYWQRIAARKEAIATPFSRLNEVLSGGLEPQRLVVLLGAPGGGKTTLANHLAVHAADSGRPVFYVTSEDLPATLLAKTIARKGAIDYRAVLKGYESERARITEALQDYKASPAAERLHYLDASSLADMDMIRELAAAHFQRYKDAGQGVLVIDYLQRLARAQSAYREGNRDLRQAVTVLTEQLRAYANELDCCVLALAAQHRASGYGAASSALTSAKESGDIEYTADVMMAIGEDDNRTCETSWLKPRVLRIDKNRQGESDVVIPFDWYGSRQQFTEVSRDEYSYESVPATNGRSRKAGR